MERKLDLQSAETPIGPKWPANKACLPSSKAGINLYMARIQGNLLKSKIHRDRSTNFQGDKWVVMELNSDHGIKDPM